MSAASLLVRFSGSTPQSGVEDVDIDRVRLFNTRAWLVYRSDAQEWQRRRRDGSSPVVDLDMLDALMNLPVQVPISLRSVHASDLRLLRRAPAGAVEWAGGTVTRHVVPPLMPLLAMVRAADWLPGLEAASRFASYCRRLVILREMPADPEIALAQASFYGIGVAVLRGATPSVVLEPEPFGDWRPTPAWWSFSERIYQQVRVER